MFAGRGRAEFCGESPLRWRLSLAVRSGTGIADRCRRRQPALRRSPMRSVAIAAALLSCAVVGQAAAQAPLVVNVNPAAAPVGSPVPPGVGVPVVIDGVG